MVGVKILLQDEDQVREWHLSKFVDLPCVPTLGMELCGSGWQGAIGTVKGVLLNIDTGKIEVTCEAALWDIGQICQNSEGWEIEGLFEEDDFAQSEFARASSLLDA